MANLKLRIALDRYDRHVPFFMGLLKPPRGIEFEPLEVGMVPPPRRDGLDRHGRMLKGREFDVCETSLSSFLIAKSRGDDIIGVPVFPRRLFTANNMFVNVNAGIRAPADLAGRKVGIFAFQVTLSVLAKGDLKFEYGVPWEQVQWVTQHAEELSWSGGGGVSITTVPKGKEIGQMLVDGELDAVFHPHPPPEILARTDRIRRLFPDARAEAVRYFRKYGYYPIMHLLAVRPELVRDHPTLPRMLMEVWESAKVLALDFYEDPGYALLAFARNELEWQKREMAADIWPNGLKANRADLERFIMYADDQKLIPERIAVESLFHETTHGT